MKYTTNFNLKKPDYTDSSDIQNFNDNADIIDTELKKRAMTTDIPTSLPANGGNSNTINSHTASGTPATTEKTDLIKMINEVFTDANNGKTNLYNAIVGKGITPTSQTFANLVSAINAIAMGQGNAVESQVLAGATFSNSDGKLRTGNMPNLTGVRAATGVAKWPDGALAVYPEKGYQKGGSGDGEIKVSVPQLQSVNGWLQSAYIVSGAEIFGINGTATLQSLGGKRYASGTYVMQPITGYNYSFRQGQVTGLSFRPNYVYAYYHEYNTYALYMNGHSLNDSDGSLIISSHDLSPAQNMTADGFYLTIKQHPADGYSGTSEPGKAATIDWVAIE